MRSSTRAARDSAGVARAPDGPSCSMPTALSKVQLACLPASGAAGQMDPPAGC